MINVLNYKKMTEKSDVINQFTLIKNEIFSWKKTLPLSSLSEQKEENDLYLSLADYKKDLTPYFTIKRNIDLVLDTIFELDSLVDENNSIIEFLDDKDLFLIFEENTQKLFELSNKLIFSILDFDKINKQNCYIQFKSSTGGKESEDLTLLMFKSYLKMLDENNFDIEIIEHEESDGGLLTNAVIKVNNKYSFGLFSNEKGMHRFTRISPYGNGKLHTSFVFIDVYPCFDDLDTENIIKKSDVRIDKFRGSGAGGQHRNKTDSAIRLTHIETGIVVKIESERSQHQNKKIAYDLLYSKLLELKKKDNQNIIENNKGKESKIDWGSQIRSYVLEQNRVKDHRTNMVFNSGFDYYISHLYKNIIDINIKIIFNAINV